MSDDRNTPWDARHIFYAQSAHADQLILAMRDMMAELAPASTDWFYIRYIEGGAHVRWRIHDRLADIREIAFARIAAFNTDLRARDGIGQAVVNAAFPDTQTTVYAPGTTVAISYDREWDRYGGPWAIAVHEQLFGVSTQIAADIVEASIGDQQARAKQAIPLMIGTAAAMVASVMPVRTFFERYSSFWRRYWTPRGTTAQSGTRPAARSADIGALFDHHVAIGAGLKAPAEAADRWTAMVAQAVTSLRALYAAGRLQNTDGTGLCSSEEQFATALAHFCHSQIHMTNNRLGLAPSAEILLSDLISASL